MFDYDALVLFQYRKTSRRRWAAAELVVLQEFADGAMRFNHIEKFVKRRLPSEIPGVA